FLDGACLHRKRVRARSGFTQCIRADTLRSELRQILLLLIGRAPTDESVIDERVLYVDKNSDRSINSRQLFNRENRSEEICFRAAELFGRFDSHQSEAKALLDDRRVEFRGL